MKDKFPSARNFSDSPGKPLGRGGVGFFRRVSLHPPAKDTGMRGHQHVAEVLSSFYMRQDLKHGPGML